MNQSIASIDGAAAPDRAATAAGIVASCFGFVVIGALQALYGPAIPHLLAEFAITPAQAGLALSAHFVGALIGVLAFNRAHARFTNRQLLAASYGAMAAGCVLFALAPVWSVALVGAFVVGLGFGGIDFGLNFLFSVGFGRRSASMVNLLNAHFGVGAVLGPLAIALLGAENFRAIFLVFGVLALLPLLAAGTISNAVGTVATGASHAQARGRATLLVLGAFFAIYVLHVAIETGVGGWATTHLVAVGWGAAFAAGATSAYWLAMTLGRFGAAWLSLRATPAQIMVGACLGMSVSLVLAANGTLAPVAYVLVGLFIAPIFPTGLAWLAAVHPASRNATASVIAVSMVGGVAFPPLIGAVIGLAGAPAAPLFMAGLSAICVCAAALVVTMARR
ncbi:MFS transporter [Salinarimonas chemoclinalis]|uniref:MFS transporter n=1 Tax=Salinarimonas chemoclinalis TaxID=3241599 RepID=UPI0035566A89